MCFLVVISCGGLFTCPCKPACNWCIWGSKSLYPSQKSSLGSRDVRLDGACRLLPSFGNGGDLQNLGLAILSCAVSSKFRTTIKMAEQHQSPLASTSAACWTLPMPFCRPLNSHHIRSSDSTFLPSRLPHCNDLSIIPCTWNSKLLIPHLIRLLPPDIKT